MERGGCHARVTESRQAPGHLARGLVGERHDEDVARPDDPCRESVCHAAGDDPRLAAPRAGEDAQRTRRDRDRLALGRIEVGQKGVRVWGWHRPIVAARAAPAVIGQARSMELRWVDALLMDLPADELVR